MPKPSHPLLHNFVSDLTHIWSPLIYAHFLSCLFCVTRNENLNIFRSTSFLSVPLSLVHTTYIAGHTTVLQTFRHSSVQNYCRHCSPPTPLCLLSSSLLCHTLYNITLYCRPWIFEFLSTLLSSPPCHLTVSLPSIAFIHHMLSIFTGLLAIVVIYNLLNACLNWQICPEIPHLITVPFILNCFVLCLCFRNQDNENKFHPYEEAGRQTNNGYNIEHPPTMLELSPTVIDNAYTDVTPVTATAPAPDDPRPNPIGSETPDGAYNSPSSEDIGALYAMPMKQRRQKDDEDDTVMVENDLYKSIWCDNKNIKKSFLREHITPWIICDCMISCYQNYYNLIMHVVFYCINASWIGAELY